MAFVRIVLGVLVGIAAGIGVVFIGDRINHALWPPPEELRATDPEAVRAFLEGAPVASLIGLPLFWTIAAFVAALIAARIPARVWTGWLAGGVMLALTLLNLALIPHPLWMLIATIVAVPAGVWFGARLGARGRRRAEH